MMFGQAGGLSHHFKSRGFLAMILLFPDLDTVRLALTSNLVPTDLTLAPAAVSFDAQGKVYVEPTVALPRGLEGTLKKIGVKGSKRHGSDAVEEVACWPQILPTVRDTATPQLSSQAAVLFELESADDLPTLVTEMLRLGNDRQSFRWFAVPGEPDAARVLLRVIGPPYYTLLRALDRSAAGMGGGVRAYLERAPRVWVEIGHAHPLGDQIRVADGQLLLVRPPREWVFLDEAPFRDVYDILQFKLPKEPVGWTPTEAQSKMRVPLRLTAGNATDVPELWVLRENAVEQLDTLVRDADDRLTQRLTFAVATGPDGRTAVVLRTRPSKLAPPVLPVEGAVGFKPFWKLPNLFLPAGRRLHPTLRRDAVRKLLADDPDRVVWLFPDGTGVFTPESVADSAFLPLEEWVNYVIEAEQEPLAAWIESTRFDFDQFVCPAKDAGGPKPKPGGDKEPRPAEEHDDDRAAKAGATKPAAKGKAGAKPAVVDFVPAPAEVKPPNVWEVRRAELEKEFLAVDGPLDDPARIALWPQLAEANAGTGKSSDEAAVCWLNALWSADSPQPGWLAGWVRSELPGSGGKAVPDDVDRRLKSQTPSANDYRAVVAVLLWAAAQRPVPAWLRERLPAILKYLEAHERALPVRAVWLAGFRLAQLNGGDVLGLARVRDRLLLRLLEEGLSPERDLPIFLRTAGLTDSERMRAVREKALELHQDIRRWVEASAAAQKNEPIRKNLPYVDLLFAFALAKLGESTPARRLLDDAGKLMEVPVPDPQPDNKNSDAVQAAEASRFLYRAFRYRVEQVMAGKPHTGQLADDLLAALADLRHRGETAGTNNPYTLAEYVVNRMREQSRILEPHERHDPYGQFTKLTDVLKKELTEAAAIREPGKLADRLRRLFKEGVQGKTLREVQFHLLHEGLPLAARVGEAFTVELLGHVPAVLAAGPGGLAAAGPTPSDVPKKTGELVERALFLAAHFDRGDIVQTLAAQFADLVHGKPEKDRYRLINAVGGQALRSLKKLGLRDQIDQLLVRLQGEVLKGATLTDLKRRFATKPDEWAAALQTLLNLAAGWLTFGLTEHALPILDEAKAQLLAPGDTRFPSREYTEMGRAYIAALGQGPSDLGLPRITELFRKMDPNRVTNTWTTAPFYSRFHLNLAEAVIAALVSDEFALGPAGRRWLDDDEFLVRERVHADMKRNLTGHGL
jgi:hypothetical protein